MKATFRTFCLGLLTVCGLTAMAQTPYYVVVYGQVANCTPNTLVTIQTQAGTLPAQTLTTSVNANCSFSAMVNVDSPSGGILAWSSCGNGTASMDSGSYVFSTPFDSASIQLNLSCGGVIDPCDASFTVQQAMNGNSPIPWQMTTTNTSTGAAPIMYQWWMPNGSSSAAAEPTFTFTQSGVYGICLTITTGNCTSVLCDTVVVDSMGYISNNSIWYDCQGVLWGPNTPGTSCDDGNPATSNDTWSAACQCVGQGGGMLDCLGIPGGFNLPGTACADSTGSGNTTGTWDANCICQPDSGITDCLGIVNGPNFPGTPCDDGNPATSNDTWSAACQCVGQGGGMLDCLGIPGGSNLPGTACADSTWSGNITGIWDANCSCQPDSGITDCLGIVNGPNFPGTSCTTPAGGIGTWSAACVCMEDSSGSGCNADFWPIQAYDSTATGGMEPIPNEVWVWNLSSGGNGNYQFFWDFGDGSGSTDAYPTHVYNSDGPWLLCLTMTSANCTDTYCDTISVDANGILNELVISSGGGNVEHEGTFGTRSEGFTLNVIQHIPTGITEVPAFAELKAWPNPVLNELNLTFNTSVSGTVPVTVIDPSGRTVITASQNLTTGSNTFRISTDDLGPGLYMVRIGNDARSITQRFMKVR
ncbi:MAG: T9SS type A sorting domain-containing protein [Flavobacteriales bacterium]|jgi:hypothetical protein|nr:T9SS type A sorting domain-containing protein [Flavobacteriales bacterium]MBK6893524.1 T9SS type A sorting domain-containing protein [Flavobacteriales bacterium]MBK7248761.1 T9SS type A sorting domain-containing protein [Flavobacteriales bacterium]MBK9599311.1 T9SS type A sorting domain-containing protein [Flavobacteriales bacterium]QQS73998.1 MAG: T9SS type A sorting domain-containing protein [Flavobacteriales bacterium]